MSVVLSDTHPLMRKTSRLILLVMAFAVGFGGGFYWQPEISAGAYDGFVNLFADPGIQITGMAMGVAVAYLVGMEGEVLHEWRRPFSTVWDASAAVRRPQPDSHVYFRKAMMYPNGDLLVVYKGVGDTP